MEETDPAPFISLRPDAVHSDDMFRVAIEASPTGVLLVEPAGTIALVNGALERQFGYRRNELIGQPLEVLLPESLQSVHIAHRSGYSTQPETRPMGAGRELFGRRKDGSEFPVEIGLNAIRTPDGLFVLASVVDISERRRYEDEYRREVRERLDFERLVAQLSATFVNLDASLVDRAIHHAQSRIGATLDLDRSSLFQFSETDDSFLLTHSWARDEEPEPPRLMGKDRFPWSVARICNGELACFSSIDEIPNAIERDTQRHFGTKSCAAFPLSIGGRIVGAIAFRSGRDVRVWSAEIIGRLQLIAQVFAGALARQRSDLALRASEERFRTLADESPVMIWVSSLDKACTWFNRQWLTFVGQTLAHEGGHGWAGGVHPDDLESCLHIYTTAFEERRSFSMEYRLRRHDGEWRWVLDNGAPTYDVGGAFSGYLGSCIDVTDEKEAKRRLENALAEVGRLRDQLQDENTYLRREVQERLGSGPIVGRSASLRRVMEQLEHVAPTGSTVLLLGETGTGKELFAAQIHERSTRATRTMVRVNCAAIPPALIESELFGRERGAFTGALARQIGRFELADHSTIFLDEIGDLPLEVQVKLLHVLEHKQLERLGSPKAIPVDTRIIAATHRDLEQLIADGLFREDLFYRLNVFPVSVPPLRERAEDIPLLVWRFVEEFSKAFGKPIEVISRDNMAALQRYSWPGNIRELRNVVERAMIVATGPRLTITVPSAAAAGKRSVRLDEVERAHIRHVLDSAAWRIRGAGGAAEQLGLKPTTLESRIAKLGLRRPANP